MKIDPGVSNMGRRSAPLRFRRSDSPRRVLRALTSFADDRCIRMHGITLHLDKHQVSIDGNPVDLTPMELCVLKVLLEHPSQVIRKADLLDACHDGYADVTEKALTMLISRLRTKLGSYKSLIKTVYGTGYMLDVPPEEVTLYSRGVWALLVLLWAKLRSAKAATVVTGSATTASLITLGTVYIMSDGFTPSRTAPPSMEIVAVAVIEDVIADEAYSPIDRPFHLPGDVGSSLAYTGSGDRFVTVSDPGTRLWHGDVAYLKTFEIQIDMHGRPQVHVQAIGADRLRDEYGRVFRTSRWARSTSQLKRGFNGEPVRVGPMNTVYVADQAVPRIGQFDRRGQCLQTIVAPKKFWTHLERGLSNDNDGVYHLINQQRSVRADIPKMHGGFEALATTPGDWTLLATTGSPLITDAPGASVHVRLLAIPRGGKPTQEFIYELEHPHHRLHELVAVNDQQFLALERDGRGTQPDRFSRLYLIDISDASDVSHIPALPESDLHSGIRTVRKELFADMLHVATSLPNEMRRQRIEGLSFAPNSADGRHILLGISDNEQSYQTRPTLFVFAIDANRLPGLHLPIVGTGD